MPKVRSEEGLSVSDLASRHFKPSKGKSLTSVLDAIQRKSKEDVIRLSNKVSNLILKHRWMKGRNLVVNNTVVSFNDNGFAYVPNLGNALLDCQVLVRRSGGLIEFYSPNENKEPLKDQPVEEKPVEVEEDQQVEEVNPYKDEEELQEYEFEGDHEEEPQEEEPKDEPEEVKDTQQDVEEGPQVENPEESLIDKPEEKVSVKKKFRPGKGKKRN